MRYLLLLYGEPGAAVESAERLRHGGDGTIEVRQLLDLGGGDG